MSHTDRTEVLVVGAGPVGMLTALLLGESGIRVRLIDRESRTAVRSYACALHSHTLKVLNQAGLASEVLHCGRPIDTIAFEEGGVRHAELKLSIFSGEPHPVLVLPQNALEEALLSRISRCEKITLDWNCRLADLKLSRGEVTATIDRLSETAKGYMVKEWESVVDKTFQVSADYVVGADGRHSHVRQCLGIEYEQAGDPSLFVVYELESNDECGNEMRVVLGDTTTSVMWPFSGNKCRWSFQLFPADAPDDFPVKDRIPLNIEGPPGEDDCMHRFLRLIAQRAPWFQGKVKELGWSADVQFERRLALQFGRGRCWLAGDAAHQTGPVGMQSMNGGLVEAAELATIIRRILRESGSVDLLQDYNDKRLGEWRRLLGISGAPKVLDKASPWVKAHSNGIPACLPASGADLTTLLYRLGLVLE
jgi:2-polyprenyl-6-methoxyphenol hydroxylase-like FAD-dependent oxidoreductase